MLQSLGNYFSIDLSYIFKGGFWLALSQTVTLISGLLVAIAFAYFLPKEVYGNYKYAISVGSVVASFTLTGLGPAVIRSVARRYENVLAVAFLNYLKWSVFTLFLTLGVAGYYYLEGNSNLALAVMIIGFLSPVIGSARLYSPFLQGKKDFKTDSLYRILRNIILTTSIILAVILSDNFVLIILVSFLTKTCTAGAFYYLTASRSLKRDNRVDDNFLGFSKHLSVMKIMGTFRRNLDSILVFHYLGAVELAVYTYAVIVPKYITGIIKNIGILAMPKFSEAMPQVVRKRFFAKVAKLIIFVVPIFLIYFVSAPYIYSFFFPQYLESVPYSQIFGLTILLVGASNLTGVYFESQMAIKQQYVIVFCTTFGKIIFLTTLVEPYGVWGIIGGTLLNQGMAVLLSLFLIKKSVGGEKGLAL